FVQGPDDAEPPRKIMDEMGVRLPLIAKVEKPQAVAALDEVVAAFDGIMVARGDLGVEYPLEQVPLVQKRAIKLARQAAKPVIVRAAAEVGAAVGARALVAFTMTGETARRLARCRSPIPLLAFTTESATRSQLALTWGAETFLVPPVAHTDDMVRQVEVALREITRCEVGDLVVMVAGSPPGTPGRTNALRVHRIGDAVDS